MGPTHLSTSSLKIRPVFLEWGGIECSHRNGNITHFVLNITRNESESWQEAIKGDAVRGGSYIVCGLEVGVRYSVTVAGVNSLNQTGVYRHYDDIFIRTGKLYFYWSGKVEDSYNSAAVLRTYTMPLIIARRHDSEVYECTSPVRTAPQNFVVDPLPNDPARILTAYWSPPIIPNGHAINYTLTCKPFKISPIKRLVTGHFESNRDVDRVNVTLEGLSPSTMYNCSVWASNSVGAGPPSHTTITTADDGKDIAHKSKNV